MGMLTAEIPVIDMIGSHVTFISGVFFEASGGQVIATRYLETKVGGILTHEVVSKDAMSMDALANLIMAASKFLAEHVPSRLGKSH